MNSHSILAADIGFGNLKAVWGNSTSEQICYPSICPRSMNPSDSGATAEGLLMSNPDRVSIQVGDNHYFVGPDAIDIGSGNPLLGHDYIQREEHLALLRGAIHYMFKRTGVVRKSIDALVVGLPVSNFSRQKSALGQLCRLSHPIPVPRGLQAVYGPVVDVTVSKVMVLPQPLGALRAFSKIHSGSPLDPSRTNLVIDIGYNTFDWLCAKGFSADYERSGSFDGGMAQIARAVAQHAGKGLGVGSINLVETEKGIRSGQLFVGGRLYPMAPYLNVIQSTVDEVIDRFSSAIDLRRRFDHVILAGGAAQYYLAGLRRLFPDHQIDIEPESVMSNARGFYQIATDILTVRSTAATTEPV